MHVSCEAIVIQPRTLPCCWALAATPTIGVAQRTDLLLALQHVDMLLPQSTQAQPPPAASRDAMDLAPDLQHVADAALTALETVHALSAVGALQVRTCASRPAIGYLGTCRATADPQGTSPACRSGMSTACAGLNIFSYLWRLPNPPAPLICRRRWPVIPRWAHLWTPSWMRTLTCRYACWFTLHD
jgi:hypothetical protein